MPLITIHGATDMQSLRTLVVCDCVRTTTCHIIGKANGLILIVDRRAANQFIRHVAAGFTGTFAPALAALGLAAALVSLGIRLAQGRL